ncbi:MAG: 4-hydroxy-3-methylbut-2-enyl diphosphate reductase [Coriobacteriia bacterium]
MRVITAKHAGVCYGVERALKLAVEAAESGGPVHTLGPLIHNPQAVAELEAQGIQVAADLDEVSEGTVVIRSHGVDPAVIRSAQERGLTVVDATCPFVSTVHESAKRLIAEEYEVIIVGEPDHPEVEGILAHAGGLAKVVEEASDVPRDLKRKVGVVVQTTQSAERLAEVVETLLPRVKELRVFNTICSATVKRQDAARELAAQVDAVVVVGGHNSGNTTRLAEICRSVNPNVHHVETAEELEPEWFEGLETVGVTAGASTPSEQMQRVIDSIERLSRG